MNLRQIREECWAIARDTALVDSDRLWPQAEMNSYINRIYRHIARETRCIRDAYTRTLCRIDVAPPADLAALTALAATDVFANDDLIEYNTVGSWLYQQLVAPRTFSLNALILDIDEVKWKNQPWRLRKVSVSKWQENPFWERVMGYPTEFATDYTNNAIVLNYRTTATDTLLMTIRRLPVADLIADTDTPEFRTNYHDYFRNGVLWQMYAKQDADIIDKTKSEEYHAKFLVDLDDVKQQETILDQRLKSNYAMPAFL